MWRKQVWTSSDLAENVSDASHLAETLSEIDM
jgi:hypothetical protein